MRKSLLTLAIISSFAAPALALAQTAPAAAPAPAPSPVTGNMTIASDYRFRGISQTYKGPAIQGGIDYAHDSGFYVGNWNSNVSSNVYSGGSGIEMDFYGGWKKAFGDFGLDVGFIYYYYPNAQFNGAVGNKKFDNQEVYVGGSWKWISAKYSYAVSDYFGLNREQAAGGYWVNQNTGAALGDNGNSKGTTYLDVTANYPVTEKFSVIGHYGRLNVKHYSDLNYSDYKVGATYDLNGWILGASLVSTNAKKEWYYTAGAKGNRNVGESTVVFSVAKTF